MKTAKTTMDRQTRMAAVVFADLVGFSKKTVPAQLATKEALTSLLQRLVAGYPKTARVVLDTGDGAAVGFLVNPESALALALRLRRELAGAADDALLRSSDLRLGLNLGPVKVVTDVNGQPNIVGEGINSAERIMSFAEPGSTTASRSFQEAVFYLDPAFQGLFQPLGTRADKHGREHEVFRLTASADAIDAALQSLGIGPTALDGRAAAGRATTLVAASTARLGGVAALGRPARVALAAGIAVVIAATVAWYAWPARRAGAPIEASTPPAVTAPARPEPAAARPEPPPAAASLPAPPAAASSASEPPRAAPVAPAAPDASAAAVKKAKAPAPAPKSALAGAPIPPQGASRAAEPATPAATPARAGSPRCSQLLQRAAVGEALTPDEQRELATTCR